MLPISRIACVPKPMHASVTLSLGATNPVPPRTCRGTMVTAAAAAAAPERNPRRFISDGMLPASRNRRIRPPVYHVRSRECRAISSMLESPLRSERRPHGPCAEEGTRQGRLRPRGRVRLLLHDLPGGVQVEREAGADRRGGV